MSRPILMDEHGRLIRGAKEIMQERLHNYYENQIQEARQLERLHEQAVQKERNRKALSERLLKSFRPIRGGK